MKAKRLLPAVLMVLILAIVLTGISVINKKRNVGKGEQYQNPNVEVVKITLDEWIGWKSLLDANGGLRTTSDSINAKNGIIVEYIVENDAEKSSDMLISGDTREQAIRLTGLHSYRTSLMRMGHQLLCRLSLTILMVVMVLFQRMTLSQLKTW